MSPDHASPWNRRDVLRGLSAAGAGAALGLDARAFAAPEHPPIPIVDSHQHLWDRSRLKLPWLAAAPALDHDATPDDYRKASEGLGVVKTVYMEVDVTPAQQEEEARSILALIRSGKTPTAAAVISGRPASEGFAAYLAKFLGDPEIKGVRQVLHSSETPRGYCLDPAFVRGIKTLGTLGLTFDLCMRHAELPDAAKLVDACPGTTFVLDHCGNPDVFAHDLSRWRADLAELARRERVVCKVSGILASVKGKPWTAADLAPVVNHVLNSFGPDRVLFGGDWPVCTLGGTLREWVEALKTIVRDRPEADRRKLFSENAVRVYRLPKS